ncbi:UDP-2,3-diacylglucosamine pyrophosphatase LpxH [Marinobacter segnicrescens]|uniref:UDP-2,3-diacylglucosamine pyrophosphatase LpxH n=1 Tax=Marinobacter segnicrescens TaxID=430453 RepID=A0A1I0ECU5_9GAMM|nr:UDP-2,3-diacylglucosamine diphosphatase [Marinobacter segnicrescens]SET43009.1 UDP-2,3-diacylglucosamine pyrophosphatase LpxH [Marinobacter segnicrescens]
MPHYRSVFISDVHLGTADCQAEYLLDFLEQVHCDTLYLVGDIVDLIAMQRRVHLSPAHGAVIQKLLSIAAGATRVVYVPGNHDEFLRRFCGQTVAGVELRQKVVHTTADGRRFMVCHGDQFDQVVRCSPLMLLVGDRAHGLLLRLNRWFNAWRRLQGKPYWSLAAWIKGRIGSARTFIRRFELAALTAAEKGHYDGFICGHIHSAGFLRSPEGLYCNDGDWVEHCTALVEQADGQLQLLHWSEQPAIIATEPEAPAPEVCGDRRPVIDILPAAFLDQVNRI